MEILKPTNEEKIIEAKGLEAWVRHDGKLQPMIY